MNIEAEYGERNAVECPRYGCRGDNFELGDKEQLPMRYSAIPVHGELARGMYRKFRYPFNSGIYIGGQY